MGESSAKKKKGEMRMIKQNRGNQNKFIYNNKNAYLSVPLLMMSARRMNLCKEKKKGWGWGGGGGGEEDDEKEREKKSGRHPVWAKQPKPNEQQQQQIYLK